MDLAGFRSPFEATAKAALLNFLRERGMLDDTVVVSELELPSYGRRADLVLIGEQPMAVEIKTKADSLARLPDQLGTFCRAFPAAYAAVATEHLKKTLSIAPQACGIIELRERRTALEVRIHRRPRPFTLTSPLEQASLLPAKELGRALRGLGVRASSKARRAELVQLLSQIKPQDLSPFVTRYLRLKYAAPSGRFVATTTGRHISSDDIRLLRLWEPTLRSAQQLAVDPDVAFFGWLTAQAGDQPLGKVPADIAARLAA